VNTIPPAYAQFGQTLAFAERTLTAILHQHLAEHATAPETWYALQLIATRGPGLSREALIRDLEGSPNVESRSVGALMARLDADRLIRGGAEIDLTAEGEALHRGLREYINGPTVALLS
jgi:hypothetical protein